MYLTKRLKNNHIALPAFNFKITYKQESFSSWFLISHVSRLDVIDCRKIRTTPGVGVGGGGDIQLQKTLTKFHENPWFQMLKFVHWNMCSHRQMWHRKSYIFKGFHCKFLSELEKCVGSNWCGSECKNSASYLPPLWGLYYIVLYCVVLYCTVLIIL